jgi:hypothetical protein
MTTQEQQDAAAHEELKLRGWSDERIAQNDAQWAEHKRQQMAIARGETTDNTAQ